MIFPCERCSNSKPERTTASVFVVEQVCEDCEGAEKAHPRYPAAHARREKAFREDDFGYEMPGLPEGFGSGR